MPAIGGGPTASSIAESSTVKVAAVAAAAATLASNAANMSSDSKVSSSSSSSPPAPLTAATMAMEKKEWNTKNLGRRVAVDALAAATAGGLVAPIVSMIDK
jgi:hypothetical protein